MGVGVGVGEDVVVVCVGLLLALFAFLCGGGDLFSGLPSSSSSSLLGEDSRPCMCEDSNTDGEAFTAGEDTETETARETDGVSSVVPKLSVGTAEGISVGVALRAAMGASEEVNEGLAPIVVALLAEGVTSKAAGSIAVCGALSAPCRWGDRFPVTPWSSVRLCAEENTHSSTSKAIAVAKVI